MVGTGQDSSSENHELDLHQALQELEQYQADLNYHQAQASLHQLLEQLDLAPQEAAELAETLDSLEEMLTKLQEGVVHIAVFGLVGRGKSSLLNALLGQDCFATGPIHGVTQTSSRAVWAGSAGLASGSSRVVLPGLGQSRVELIDTPGLDEVGGEARQILAQGVAQQADLILFVISGDMTKLEHQALWELRQASKPILLVFNKVDQYPEADRQAIYAKIRDERVRDILTPNEIVLVAAAPLVPKLVHHPDGRITAELTPGPPQVEDLKLKILQVLQEEGKALVALNTLLFADGVNTHITARKMVIRDSQANQLIWKSATAKALAIALNPITMVDIVSSLVIDLTMIQTLAKLYGLEMTREGATQLLQKIALTMGGISASELLANLGLSSLKGILGLAAPATGGASLVPYVSVAMTQAGIAGFSSYTVGQVSKEYLANGASWGVAGPKTVVRDILASLDQSEILGRLKLELQKRLRPSRA